MSQTGMTTNWEFYDRERHDGKGGNYMFLLKPFGNAPYYSGEAKDFADRFVKNGTSHQRQFADGMRVIMRRPFIAESTDRSHAGFATRWDHYKQQTADEQKRLVWVPTKSHNEAMGLEGAAYQANEMALLVSTTGEDRHAVEGRVQLDIMDYYNRLLGRAIDWYTSPPSRLVGKGRAIVTDPRILYQLNGGQAGDAAALFKLLEKL